MNYFDICGPQKLWKFRMKAETQIMEFFCFCLRPTPNHRTLLIIYLISCLTQYQVCFLTSYCALKTSYLFTNSILPSKSRLANISWTTRLRNSCVLIKRNISVKWIESIWWVCREKMMLLPKDSVVEFVFFFNLSFSFIKYAHCMWVA